jgi:hypothetical protein
VDGSGSISKEELGGVMQTLYNVKLTPSELAAMVKDVDKDGDGEVSFEEFVEKVQDIMLDKEQGLEGENDKMKHGDHWRKLGNLVKSFQKDNETNGMGFSANRKHLFENQKKLEAEKKKVELSRQHDQMVKHFNLRRMSVDIDEDTLKAQLSLNMKNLGIKKNKDR